MHIGIYMHMLTTSIARKTNLLFSPTSLIFGAIFGLGSSLAIKKIRNTYIKMKNNNEQCTEYTYAAMTK